MDNIIIKKFGGTSLTDIRRVAHLIKNDIDKGYSVVAVVSAIAGLTDQLDSQVKQIISMDCGKNLSEYDVVASTGEQISCGMLAVTLQSMGIRARSWLAWQIPIVTDNSHSKSKIKKNRSQRIKGIFY